MSAGHGLKEDKKKYAIVVNDMPIKLCNYKENWLMGKQKSKLGIIFVQIYAILVIVAFLFLILMIKKTAFAGVYLVLLTLPWSIFLSRLLDFYGIQDSVPIIVKLVLFIFFALPNALILYCIGVKFEKLKK